MVLIKSMNYSGTIKYYKILTKIMEDFLVKMERVYMKQEVLPLVVYVPT